MNIKKYTFRFAMTVFAFLVGYSANSGYHKIEPYYQTAQVDETAPGMNVDSFAAGVGEIPNESSVHLPPFAVADENYDAADFNPTGEYYLADENVQGGFRDFDYLEIQTHAYNDAADPDDSWTPIPPKGSIHAKRSYKFKSVMVSPTFVAFETEAVRGISYRFAGKFSQTYQTMEEGGMANFRGRLTKLKYGKIVAAMDAAFYIGGC